MTGEQRKLVKIIIDSKVRASLKRPGGAPPDFPPATFISYGPPSTWKMNRVSEGGHLKTVPRYDCPQCEDREDCPIHESHTETTYFFRAVELGYDVGSLRRQSEWDVPEGMRMLPKGSLSKKSAEWLDRWRGKAENYREPTRRRTDYRMHGRPDEFRS